MRKMLLFLALVILVFRVASSAHSLDVSTLPPEIQARHYVRKIGEAIENNDNKAVVELCEALILNTELEIDAEIGFFYARSLLALDRREEAAVHIEAFLNTPGIDEELIDEALAILEQAGKPDRLATAKQLLSPAVKEQGVYFYRFDPDLFINFSIWYIYCYSSTALWNY